MVTFEMQGFVGLAEKQKRQDYNPGLEERGQQLPCAAEGEPDLCAPPGTFLTAQTRNCFGFFDNCVKLLPKASRGNLSSSPHLPQPHSVPHAHPKCSHSCTWKNSNNPPTTTTK